jgi:hypothetical protein
LRLPFRHIGVVSSPEFKLVAQLAKINFAAGTEMATRMSFDTSCELGFRGSPRRMATLLVAVGSWKRRGAFILDIGMV